jgi:hypothetical protein
VGPNLTPHALTEVEFGESKKSGGIFIAVVYRYLPAAGSFQDNASGVEKLVGSVIIPSLHLHTYLPPALRLTWDPVTLQQD